ncbi:MAG: hypothetical protein Q9218_007576, partial [Villophora microphyllina]
NTSNPGIPSETAPTILNDTFLAAVLLANGDRHLFFQDSGGLVRRAVRSASTGQWNTSPYLNVTSNAKKRTPLAATFVEQLDGKKQFELFYVTSDDKLSSSVYYMLDFQFGVPEGEWNPGNSFGNLSVAANTRHLSVSARTTTKALGPGINTDQALLFYEKPNDPKGYNSSQWIDISTSSTIPIFYLDPRVTR